MCGLEDKRDSRQPELDRLRLSSGIGICELIKGQLLYPILQVLTTVTS
jgi:hypothetical protein